ncbi:unnamed protein product [Camellia sinensis]
MSWETTEEKLKDHCEADGEVLQTVVRRDKTNGPFRDQWTIFFFFVVVLLQICCVTDPSILERVLQEKHRIDGRTVEAKRAIVGGGKEDVVGAITELTNAIAFKPDLQLLYLRAAFHDSMGDCNSTIRDCEAALCLDLSHTDTLELYRKARERADEQQQK